MGIKTQIEIVELKSKELTWDIHLRAPQQFRTGRRMSEFEDILLDTIHSEEQRKKEPQNMAHH